jgi:hypothetical protein
MDIHKLVRCGQNAKNIKKFRFLFLDAAKNSEVFPVTQALSLSNYRHKLDRPPSKEGDIPAHPPPVFF